MRIVNLKKQTKNVLHPVVKNAKIQANSSDSTDEKNIFLN